MNGVIFTEQLKQSWKLILSWGFGLGLLTFYISAVVEDASVIEQYAAVLESMPPAFLSAFGLSDASFLTSAEGFIAFAGFTYGSLGLAVFGVLAGLNITANDEDSGMMNILLALPTPRWQIIVERFAAYTVILLGIIGMLFGGVVLGAIIFTIELDFVTMFMGAINLIPATLTIMAVTAFIGGTFSNKIIVTTLSAGFVLVSYVLNVIASAVDASIYPIASLAEIVSVFNYLDSESVIINGGLHYGNIAILLSLTVILLVVAVFAFERRDIRG